MIFDLIRQNFPYAIAALLILYTLLRRRARATKRAQDAAAQRADARKRMRVLANKLDGETISFEVYNERLERQRELIERYNREHGESQS